MRSRYLAADIEGTGPISATLLPPGEDPPGGPSVNSQTFPAACTASAVGPAAASAWARFGKLSMRQNHGPGGNCMTFFSANGVTLNSCARAVEVSGKPSIVIAHR